MKRRTFITFLGLFTSAGVILALFVLGVFFKQDITLSIVITCAFIACIAVMLYSIEQMRSDSNKEIENSLELSYKEVLNHGDIGIITYNENFEITFMSDFFEKRNMEHIGEKILNWLPELQDMLANEGNIQTVIINEEKFLVRKIANAFVLIFKNVTEEYDLDKRLDDEALVLGLLNYDNYDELTMSEDELSYINANNLTFLPLSLSNLS